MEESVMSLRYVLYGVLCALSACGGGGGEGGDGSPPPPPPGPQTSLSCEGFPQPVVVFVNGVQQTYTKACVILQDFAATTPNVGASTKVGNISAHGGAEISSAYVVYTRVIAQAADQGAATALAR